MRNNKLQKSNRQFLWSTMALAIMVLAMVFVMMYMASCTNGKSCLVTGECGDSVSLAYFSVDYFNSDGVDSVKVKDGKFTIESPADTIGFRIVQTVDGHTWVYFIEPGHVTLNEEGYSSGTPLNDSYHKLQQSIQNADDEECEKLFNDFITANKDNIAGVIGVLSAADYLPMERCVPLLEMLSAEQQAKVFVSIPKEEFYHVDKIKVGDMFTDFEVEYEGQIKKLSDYVGKGNYTLVDFWASWCGPCKGEIPNLKKLHEDFGDKGLTVLGVATWDKPEDTMGAIEELGITYPQIINAQSIGSDAYDFKGIPMIILFDKDGHVLYKDLRGEDMVAKVSALFE